MQDPASRGASFSATATELATTINPSSVLSSSASRVVVPPASMNSVWPLVISPRASLAMVRFGGDCYGYGLLASGHIDLIIESGLEPYDYLALVAVVEGAGGVISDWRGRPLGLDACGQVVAAASAELHNQALAMIAAVAR